jgi:FkbM family methyltransferase
MAGVGFLGVVARHAWFVEDEIAGLNAVVRPGDVCVDVGAEYGLYTRALSRIVGPGGAVHAIEPLPGAFRILSALAPRNVAAHRLALGEQPMSAVLSLPYRHGLPTHGRAYLTAGSLHAGPNIEFGFAREVEAEVMSLDGFCAREGLDRLNFIKADIEGAELLVLRAAARTLADHHPSLLLEIEDRHTRKYGYGATDLIDWLGEQGYRPLQWIGDAWRPVTGWDAERRNYLFLHSTREVPA